MAKDKTIWVCSSCGGEAQKWMGKCTYCGAWDTYYEEKAKNVKAREGKEEKERWDKRTINSKTVDLNPKVPPQNVRKRVTESP